MRNIDEKKYEQYVKQLTPNPQSAAEYGKSISHGRTDLSSWPGHLSTQHRLSVQTLPMPEPGVLYFSSS